MIWGFGSGFGFVFEVGISEALRPDQLLVSDNSRRHSGDIQLPAIRLQSPCEAFDGLLFGLTEIIGENPRRTAVDPGRSGFISIGNSRGPNRNDWKLGQHQAEHDVTQYMMASHPYPKLLLWRLNRFSLNDRRAKSLRTSFH